MTVTRDMGKIVFHCDGKKCHEYLETDCRYFPDAVIMLKESEWVAVKEDDDQEWAHYCPECIGDEYET